MAATTRSVNCTATPDAAGCQATPHVRNTPTLSANPPSSKPPTDKALDTEKRTTNNKTLPVKTSPEQDAAGTSEGIHPVYGKYVRISDLIPKEDTAKRPKTNDSLYGAAGSGPGVRIKALSTLSDSNATGLGIGGLRQPISGGAGSPDPAPVVVPAVIGGILATVLAVVLLVLLLKRRKHALLRRKKKEKTCEIEMDIISPQTELKPAAELYAVVDKKRKLRQSSSGSSPEQQPLRPLREYAQQNGTGSSSTLRMNSRLSLPGPPLPERNLENGACVSDAENEYDIPENQYEYDIPENQYEDTDDKMENVYESTEEMDKIGENMYESTEDVQRAIEGMYKPTENDAESKAENVYETTDENVYALYDATHRQIVDGVKPDPNRIPNITADNIEDHVYESTEVDGENIYEAADWPTRPPLPPIRPLSLPVLKTPPQIRPGHLLPKKPSRPVTIGATPPEFDLSEYQHNPDDYDAYLQPICHDHSWSSCHTYDPVYEKAPDGSGSFRNSQGHVIFDRKDRSESCLSCKQRNRILPKSPNSGSDSSVYEYIEGGDNRHSVCRSDNTQTDSSVVNNRSSHQSSTPVQSVADIELDEDEECEHEYTPLTEVSSPHLPCVAKQPVEPEADDNIYEPYAFHNRT